MSVFTEEQFAALSHFIDSRIDLVRADSQMSAIDRSSMANYAQNKAREILCGASERSAKDQLREIAGRACDAASERRTFVGKIFFSGPLHLGSDLTIDMIIAGAAAARQPAHDANDLVAIYRAMHAARPKREVKDDQIAGFLYEFGRGDGALDIEGARAALQAFADGRDI